MRSPRDRLAVALDVPTLADARALAHVLAPEVGVLKVGLELFIAEGPAAVHAVHEAGAACFLDLKLHDIPATVAGAVRSLRDLGVRYATVHASAGPEALAAAVKAVEGSDTELLAVTALTSLDAEALRAIGFAVPEPRRVVRRLATVAVEAGIHGFVCSAHEAALLRDLVGSSATLVTPGVRLDDGDRADQRRVATPEQAIRAGADVLVVGRPVRNAPDPAAAARAIVASIAEAAS
ncbi:MAG: orotidine-5'-phosphate decarboxylase [Sandaracinaceae bacterium]|nr:orotidine-5'-phosphate decarboxylase [Sandaracinaceae bacterium]